MVILGDLDGYFYTRQEVLLGPNDEEGIRIKPENFNVNLYRGTITNAETLPEFIPQEYENYKSLCLVGVPPLVVEPSPNTSFTTAQNLEFSSLILIDPVYVNHWYSNRDITYPDPDPDDENNPKIKDDRKDKVYVHVRSRVVGRTADQSAGVIPPDNQDNDRLQKARGCLPDAGGCLHQSTGCFAQLWKWLIWLLLLGLLWWLFKSCNESASTDVCLEAEKIKKEAALKKQELDSLNKVLEKGMQEELRNISRLYFYESSVDFTVSSEGGAGILAEFLNKYPKAGLEITGYVNGSPPEPEGTDLKRAQKVVELLKKAGISEKRIRTKPAVAGTKQADSNRQKNSEGRYFNRNMRTEATLFLLNDGE